jgi:hypothetical protein
LALTHRPSSHGRQQSPTFRTRVEFQTELCRRPRGPFLVLGAEPVEGPMGRRLKKRLSECTSRFGRSKMSLFFGLNRRPRGARSDFGGPKSEYFFCFPPYRSSVFCLTSARACIPPALCLLHALVHHVLPRMGRIDSSGFCFPPSKSRSVHK